MKKHILIYGLCGGVLIVLLKLVEYRFLVIQHSIEIYGGLIAVLFAVLGIWLGLKKYLDNPLINAAMTFAEPFPVGLIITLVSAAILRKKTQSGGSPATAEA